jgi:hypothetical protein
MDKSSFRPLPERTVPDVSKSTVVREADALIVIFKENPPTLLKPEAVTGTEIKPEG